MMRLIISFTIFTDQQITIVKPLQHDCCEKYPPCLDLDVQGDEALLPAPHGLLLPPVVAASLVYLVVYVMLPTAQAVAVAHNGATITCQQPPLTKDDDDDNLSSNSTHYQEDSPRLPI